MGMAGAMRIVIIIDIVTVRVRRRSRVATQPNSSMRIQRLDVSRQEGGRSDRATASPCSRPRRPVKGVNPQQGREASPGIEERLSRPQGGQRVQMDGVAKRRREDEEHAQAERVANVTKALCGVQQPVVHKDERVHGLDSAEESPKWTLEHLDGLLIPAENMDELIAKAKEQGGGGGTHGEAKHGEDECEPP